jgi:hypothetical protein
MNGPLRLEIEHEWTHERKPAVHSGTAARTGAITVRAFVGRLLQFDRDTGFGLREAERWQLTEESRIALGLPAFTPRRPSPPPALKTAPPPHPKQLPLFGLRD